MDLLKWDVTGIAEYYFPFSRKFSLLFIIPFANVCVKCILLVLYLCGWLVQLIYTDYS
jgi:hypothetical protein